MYGYIYFKSISLVISLVTFVAMFGMITIYSCLSIMMIGLLDVYAVYKQNAIRNILIVICTQNYNIYQNYQKKKVEKK